MNAHPCVLTQDFEMVAVCGDVDLVALFSVSRWLGEVFEPPGRDFGLDLTGVSFLDCAGFRALVAIQTYVDGAGGSVRAAGVSPAVARLLELLQLPAGSSFLAGPVTVLPPSDGVAPRDALSWTD